MTDVTIFARDACCGALFVARQAHLFYDRLMIAEAPFAFTHLEVHSNYTLLGATPSVEELVAQATADGMSHLALTDSNALYGAVAFDKACRQAGIQPILGMTLAPDPVRRESVYGPNSEGRASHSPGQLVLLATGPAGYRSLCRLSSLIQGRPDRQSVAARGLDWDALKEHAQGLICLSGGRRGEIERYLRGDQRSAAIRYISKLGGIFGQNAYLSLEIHRPEDNQIAQEIVALGERFGLPSVAVQPVYYLDPDQAPRLRLLAAIDNNRPLEETLPIQEKLHWLHPDEIARRFAAFPEALAQVGQITARCQPALPGGRSIWPVLELPGDGSVPQTPDQALAQQAKAGLTAKYGPGAPDHVGRRLQNELTAIKQSGYAPLFLIVADIVRFARQTEVPVSTRGSVANSLVAYCTGITTVDPIEHDLLFERFLNPARLAKRKSAPDIDLDFCSRRRDEVLNYVRGKYGPEQVALVATISTMRPKSAVRETAKAYGLTEEQINQLIKQLPRGWHPDPRRRSKRQLIDLLDELEDPDLRRIISKANELIGQPHHLSVHPGGLVITPGPLTDFVPVQWAPKGFLITQFDHQDLEAIGFPKLDLLGIRALTVLADTAELIRRHHDPGFRLENIPLNDRLTGDIMEHGQTIGVFQCDSAGAQRTLRQLRARTVTDLAVANAFFKPGPATGGMAQTFIRRYRGQEKVSYLHPALEPILASTKGVLLFQEQILRLATEIAGLSWDQADQLRRGMTKFQPQEMASLEAQFIAGCCRPPPKGPGFDGEQAKTLWEQVLPFAGYGFNRGHATAYADISYRSAYLKAHWPAAFFCARLADWGGFHHPAIYMAEAVRLGISIRPPHINYSSRKITLTFGDRRPATDDRQLATNDQQPTTGDRQPTLWLGLGQIRDLRRRSVQTILNERNERPFNGLRDLTERVTLQAKEVDHLIKCGALDGLGASRAALLEQATDIRRAGGSQQMAFAFETAEVPAESAAERLAWEQRLLGRPVSVHPLDLIAERTSEAIPLSRLPDVTGQQVTINGVRLPGFTGGRGFFLGDRATYIIVRGDDSLQKPPTWQPLRLRGRWVSDEWGTRWFQAAELKII